jgi:hypothetical protein
MVNNMSKNGKVRKDRARRRYLLPGDQKGVKPAASGRWHYRYRYVILASLFALLVCLRLGLDTKFSSDSQLSRNFEYIHTGMSEEAVLEILGKPIDGDDKVKWWLDESGMVTVWFENGSVVRMEIIRTHPSRPFRPPRV